MSTTQTREAVSQWQIDPAHTQVQFEVKHMMFAKVRGRFEELEGTLALDLDDPEASSVEVVIAADSITTGQEERDEHLRSPDFLDAEDYPELKFRSTSVEGLGGDEFRVTGDLTIRGETREVELDVTRHGSGTDPWGNERIAFGATTKIDRRDFGLTWNQALETGGILVGQDVMISIEAQATEATD